MCDQSSTMEELIENENFKSFYARSVAVNSQYRQSKCAEKCENFSGGTKEIQPNYSLPQEPTVRYRKVSALT